MRGPEELHFQVLEICILQGRFFIVTLKGQFKLTNRYKHLFIEKNTFLKLLHFSPKISWLASLILIWRVTKATNIYGCWWKYFVMCSVSTFNNKNVIYHRENWRKLHNTYSRPFMGIGMFLVVFSPLQ